MSSFLSKKSITLLPKVPYNLAVTGTFIFVESATGPFTARLGTSESFALSAGFKIQVSDLFTYVVLSTDNATSVDVVYWVGDGDLSYFPSPTQTDSKTYSKGSGLLQLTGGANANVVTYSGYDSGKQRRQFVLSNLDDTDAIAVSDGNGNLFDTVAAGDSRTYFTSGVLKIKNANAVNTASVVPAIVGETFYQ